MTVDVTSRVPLGEKERKKNAMARGSLKNRLKSVLASHDEHIAMAKSGAFKN